MKILSALQIKELDQFTIEHEPVSSAELMERAAKACAERISALAKKDQVIHIFCGCGNNGGDGFAIARLISGKNMPVNVYLVRYSENLAQDAQLNLDRYCGLKDANLKVINSRNDLLIPTDKNILAIDAIFGTGLNKPAEGLAADTIDHMNTNYAKIISIDVPSGLYADQSSANNKHIVRASLCLTFQSPKLAFMMPCNSEYVREFELLDIGLDATKHKSFDSPYFYLTIHDVQALMTVRKKFSHKGTFGHAMLMAGSKGKSGAALMAAKACLRSGAGLLTVHSTKDTLAALQQYLPEAMTEEDPNSKHISDADEIEDYDALAFGPGTGTSEDTGQLFKKLLNYYNGKLVLDADGLNILSENKTWLHFLPQDCILTPHVKEFERLSERTTDDFERLSLLKQFSVKHGCIVILKGAHSAVAMPDGNVFFNSSGNPGMAKGGSGDVLTGILLGLLARGYAPPKAALIGVFVHGLAGDIAIDGQSAESLLATDLIDKLGAAFHMLESVPGI